MVLVSVAEEKFLTRKEIIKYFLLINVEGVPQDPEHLKKIKELFENL